MPEGGFETKGGRLMGFLCPRCGNEVRTELEVVELRLEGRRKVRGSTDRYRTVTLGSVCRKCADQEFEERRPNKRLVPEPLRLEGL